MLTMVAKSGYFTSVGERDVAHGAMGRRIDPSGVGPIELFPVVCAIVSLGWCI